MIAIFFGSCSDFLEPKSQTEYTPRDPNSLNEMLIGEAYMQPGFQNYNVFTYHELLSDDVAITNIIGNNTLNETNYTKFKPYFAWHPQMFELGRDNNNYLSTWASTYKFIKGANAALDYVDKINGLADEKSFVKAQAYGLRAFYYFNLVNMFGEPYYYNKDALGVPLKIDSNFDLDFPGRATVKEVYEQMISDLNNAETEFLKLATAKQFEKNGRVTLPMVQLMRARVALFMEDYATAKTYSNKVINDWGLELHDMNSFTPSTTVPYYVHVKYDNPEAMWLFGSSFDMARFNSITIYPNPTNSTGARKLFNASPSLLNSFDMADLRKDYYIVKESKTFLTHYSLLAKTAISPDTYSLITSNFGRALRLSEAYLMLAEAAFKTNDDATAVQSLETLRSKRYTIGSGDAYKIPVSSTSGNALFEVIKSERRKEMCFEGLRWFDQRRWGMDSFSRDWVEEGVITTFTMDKDDPAFTLPIPHDAISKNSNLVQNKLSTPKY